MSNALCFNEVPLTPIILHNQSWIKSAELARVLAYKSEDAVSRLFLRNREEFSNDISVTVKLTVTGGMPTETRIFSLRGSHNGKSSALVRKV